MGRDRMIPPMQARSRASVDRVMAATEDLLGQRTFADISLQDICRAAGVSSSTLYARFPTKEAIRFALIERYRDRMMTSFSAEYQQLVDDPGVDLDALVLHVVTLLIAWVRQNDHLVIALKVEDAATGASYEAEELLVGALTELGAEAVGAPGQARRRDIEFAIRAAAAIVQRAVGRHTTFARRMQMDDPELARAVSDMVVRYLDGAG